MKVYIVKDELVPKPKTQVKRSISFSDSMDHEMMWNFEPDLILCDDTNIGTELHQIVEDFNLQQVLYGFHEGLRLEIRSIQNPKVGHFIGYEPPVSQGGINLNLPDHEKGPCEAYLILSGNWLNNLWFLSIFSCNSQLIITADVWCATATPGPRSAGKRYLTASRLCSYIMIPPRYDIESKRQVALFTEEMKLQFPTASESRVYCEDLKVKLPRSICNKVCNRWAIFSAKVSIALQINNYTTPKDLKAEPTEFGGNPDFMIVAEDDQEFMCHKSVLMDTSPVFNAMLSHKDMDEMKTGRVVMKNVNSNVVEAFLKYLYSGALNDPNRDASVALEMFKLGHKYGIQHLETAMETILCQKPSDWFNLNVALDLFLYAGKIGDVGERFKVKGMDLVIRNRKKLMESERFLELFKNDVKAGIELSVMCIHLAADSSPQFM